MGAVVGGLAVIGGVAAFLIIRKKRKNAGDPYDGSNLKSDKSKGSFNAYSTPPSLGGDSSRFGGAGAACVVEPLTGDSGECFCLVSTVIAHTHTCIPTNTDTHA